MPPVPEVVIQKSQFATGVVAPSPVGVIAVVAGASAGPQNIPQGFSRDTDILSTFSPGRLLEACSQVMSDGGNPVIAVRPLTSIAGGYGTIDITGSPTGTSVITAGGTIPNDNYDVVITWVNGGTIGASGLLYTYSLDGGNSTSSPQALGSGAAPITLTVPNFALGGSPNVSFSLAAGNVITGEFFRCLCHAPQSNDSDITTALAALKPTQMPFEGVLIDQDADSTAPGAYDSILAAWEAIGKFKYIILNTRMKNQAHVGTGTAETESAYLTAMTTLTAAASPTIRLLIGTDGAYRVSSLTGYKLPRPTSNYVAGRAAAIRLGEDPAYIGRGPLPNCVIVDSNANPQFHNEEYSQGLDALRLTALRTVQGQQNGVYINNANAFSVPTSDFQYLQHVRIMNRACEIAFATLALQLSRGVGKRPADSVTGKVYILASDAQIIEGLVNTALRAALGQDVVGVTFTLSRTDDLSSNAGATLTGYIAVEALAYVKKFLVTAAFAKSLTQAA